jgi:CheY-like chemotaxis protein
VEDNPDNRLLVRTLLEDEYEIREYETGLDALEGISRDPPGLILMDISLPGLDGPALLERLRTDPALPRIPAIAVTAHAMSGDRERFLAMGFDGYVAKPILDEAVLVAEIEAHLGGGSGEA